MRNSTRTLAFDGRSVALGALAVVFLLALAGWWQSQIEGDADEKLLAPLAALQLAGFILILAMMPGRKSMSGHKSGTSWLVAGAGIVFSVLLLDRIFLVHDLFEQHDVLFDIGLLSLWMAGGLLVASLVTGQAAYKPAIAAVTAGLALQLCITLTEIAEIRLETFVDLEILQVDLAEEITTVAVILLYGFALVTDAVWRRSSAGEFKLSLNEAIVELESQRLVGQLSIAANDLVFWIWQRRHPGQTFADFYAWQVTRKLDRGRAHRTLGRRRFQNDAIVAAAPEHDAASFVDRRSTVVDMVFDLGLKPSHVVVDYGCGSLRNGQHFIRFLEPGNYWGLDVTDRFYRDGLAMLPEEIVKQKAPNLRVIDARSLCEVSALNAEFIVSIAVLKHVPPDELHTFIEKLAALLSPHTRLFLTFSDAKVEARIKGKSWGYPARQIARMIEAACPNHTTRLVRIDAVQKGAGVEYRTCTMLVEPFV